MAVSLNYRKVEDTHYEVELDVVSTGGPDIIIGLPEYDTIMDTIWPDDPEIPLIICVGKNAYIPKGEQTVPAGTMAVPHDLLTYWHWDTTDSDGNESVMRAVPVNFPTYAVAMELVS